jgi:RNA polymerase sigma-70 factor (ECF subfamily)
VTDNRGPDEELARAAQAGDRSALGQLLERHQESVFAMTCRILHNRADALDAAQEAFLRICRHIRRFQPERPFGPWARRIAVRAALDQVRGRRAHDRSSWPVESLAADGPDPLSAASGTQAAERIREALALLTPAQRAAFVCKEVEGMDTREAARAMGCRRATVRWHLFEARKRLAEALSPLRGDEP